MKFTPQDIIQLEGIGILPEAVTQQLAVFKAGIPYVHLLEPATIGHGIFKYSKEEEDQFIALYEGHKTALNILKFTPASGAATRMFKFLFEFLEDYNPQKESINSFINKKKATDLRLFFVGLDDFPFYSEIRKALKLRISKETEGDINQNRLLFVKTMLEKDGFNYGNQPKGLFPFHKYKRHNASAFEEHLFEASLYAKTDTNARLHFTISEAHYHIFKTEFERIQHIVEDKTKTVFDISYSFQSRATDTIAVRMDNTPFRESNTEQLVFRPGGHGALIENLNAQDADIIFIKNIDNVVTVKYEVDVARYKKILAGKLLKLQEKVFAYLHQIDDQQLSESQIHDVVYFLQDAFNTKLSPDFEKFSERYQVEYLREQLDRPIRVCGMVQNEGEPGGGPFWVKHESGRIHLEIIESVQIDPHSASQKAIVKASTHFNPVDVVCAVNNYKGEKYNLLKFVDYKAGFISNKTIDGQPIKALEHPGLWNGAMAFWNTIFVEVPLITFNPVKTVNDLLKPAHKVMK
ncbi:MAG: hypothetical protein ACI828_000479 [Flavobacteriales bacterium]